MPGRDNNPERDWGRPSWPSNPPPADGGSGETEDKGCALWAVAFAGLAVLAIVASCAWIV